MQDRIKPLLKKHKYLEAFRLASKDVFTNEISQRYFLQILRERNSVVLLQDDYDKIRRAALKGNPFMQLAYARLVEFLMDVPDATQIYNDYFRKAADAGIADAHAYLAVSYRDGDFGEVDMPRYHGELVTAMNGGSHKAVQLMVLDLIFGYNDLKSDPLKALDIIDAQFKEAERQGWPIDPAYYSLMGDADVKLGRTGAALDEYEKAFDNGYLPALYFLALYSSGGETGNIVDRALFDEILERGRECLCSDSFISAAIILEDDDYDRADVSGKESIHNHLEIDLKAAASLGEGFAYHFLGLYYEEGMFGFEQDYAEAFRYYSHGALLRNTMCYQSMVRMILDDHTAPAHFGEKFAYGSAYLCLMLGGDTLDVVIEGYKKGLLDEHSEAIEKVYLPQYEKEVGDMIDDEDIDDDDYDDEAGEREVGEDDWSMDPDVDLSLQTCAECAQAVTERMQEQDRQWEIAGIARKFIHNALNVMDDEQLFDQLYGYAYTISDALFDHPRIKLKIMQLQLQMLKTVEASSQHELVISDDLKKKVDMFKHNIELADSDRLDEIQQTGSLKRDPVEWTQEWEDVIDKADEIAGSRLKDEPRGMGYCFSYWHERKMALASLGIEWRTPHQMNPRVMFD